MKVLVIEDNPDLAKLLREIFEIKGCVALVANNADAGLNYARSESPDIIFCDLRLPGEMSGLDLARRFRTEQGLAHIPLIAVTGYNTKKDQLEAIDAGFNMVFSKPVKFADVSMALETYGVRV